MRALIADGHPSLRAVRDMLAAPDWRPALLMASGILGLITAPAGRADPTPSFHHAPPSAESLENPYRGQQSAAEAGSELYAAHCAACHGRSAEGTGNIPALAHARVQTVPDGAVFWFITRGSRSGAMPSGLRSPKSSAGSWSPI